MAIQCCIEEERTQKVKLKALQTFLLELNISRFILILKEDTISCILKIFLKIIIFLF